MFDDDQVPEPDERAGKTHRAAVDGPDGPLAVRRAWAPFTVTERARAEAFARLLRALATVPG